MVKKNKQNNEISITTKQRRNKYLQSIKSITNPATSGHINEIMFIKTTIYCIYFFAFYAGGSILFIVFLFAITPAAENPVNALNTNKSPKSLIKN